MLFLNFDLAGAEWVVVAYISGDENMIQVCESGESPHIITGSLISAAPKEAVAAEHKIVKDATDPDLIASLRSQLPDDWDWTAFFLPRSMSIRQAGKKSNHGLNYDMKYRRFALENEIPESDAQPIVHKYNNVAYPGLPDWRKRIQAELRDGRTLTNLLGRKVRLLDAWGPELFQKAYSFKPQSTVFDVTRKAMVDAYYETGVLFEPADLQAQVHDSLLFQYPDQDVSAIAEFTLSMKRLMSVPLECEGRKFTLGVDLKIGTPGGSWGSMKEADIKDDTEDMKALIRELAGLQKFYTMEASEIQTVDKKAVAT